MAYKDEYEVARLYTDSNFLHRIGQQLSGKLTLTFHLAPPGLPGRDSQGRPRKRKFGSWVRMPFWILSRLKRLRGTAFDPFGYSRERRLERQLITDYRALVERIVGGLNEENLRAAIELARAAGEIAGYGPVKSESVREYRARVQTLLETFDRACTRNAGCLHVQARDEGASGTVYP